MVTPLKKFKITNTHCAIRSCHRRLEFIMASCPETGDVAIEITNNSVATRDEQAIKKLQDFKQEICAEPEKFIDSIIKYATVFFGESIDVAVGIVRRSGIIEVMADDEVPKSLDTEGMTANNYGIDAIENGEFATGDKNIELTSR